MLVAALFVLLFANALATDICQKPLETGPCEAYIPSFGYDPKVNECVKFVYGGCAGNENRFGTKESCEAKCLKK